MARPSIEDLAKIGLETAPQCGTPDNPVEIEQSFPKSAERENLAGKEDLTRARLASKAADASTKPTNKAKSTELAVKLDYASRGDDPPPTPASSSHMEVHRSAIRHHVSEFLRSGSTEVYAFSILTEKGEMPIDQLNAQDAVEINERLRADLKRCGATGAEGIIFAGIDGEYEVNSQQIRLHHHGIATGEMVEVVRRLRTLATYKPIVRTLGGITRRTPAIRTQRIKLAELESAVTYVVKSFWPARWEGLMDGKYIRSGRKQRIPEPEHTRILLWLDRWRLRDLTLLMGFCVTTQGLKLMRPPKNRP